MSNTEYSGRADLSAPSPVSLTETGWARRQEMRCQLSDRVRREMLRRGRQRTAFVWASCLLMLGTPSLAVTGLFPASDTTTAHHVGRLASLRDFDAAPASSFSLDQVVVHNRRQVLERYLVRGSRLSPAVQNFEELDDADLQQLLNQHLSDMVVGRLEGRTVLVSTR